MLNFFNLFFPSLLELCENLPIEGRETIIMNQILPYIKVNLTLFFVLLCPLWRQTLAQLIFICFTLKLFEFTGGQGMNETDMLMCDIVIYHLLVHCNFKMLFGT